MSCSSSQMKHSPREASIVFTQGEDPSDHDIEASSSDEGSLSDGQEQQPDESQPNIRDSTDIVCMQGEDPSDHDIMASSSDEESVSDGQEQQHDGAQPRAKRRRVSPSTAAAEREGRRLAAAAAAAAAAEDDFADSELGKILQSPASPRPASASGPH